MSMVDRLRMIFIVLLALLFVLRLLRLFLRLCRRVGLGIRDFCLIS